MLERKEVLNAILKGCTEKFNEQGFELVTSVVEENDSAIATVKSQLFEVEQALVESEITECSLYKGYSSMGLAFS